MFLFQIFLHQAGCTISNEFSLAIGSTKPKCVQLDTYSYKNDKNILVDSFRKYYNPIRCALYDVMDQRNVNGSNDNFRNSIFNIVENFKYAISMSIADAELFIVKIDSKNRYNTYGSVYFYLYFVHQSNFMLDMICIYQHIVHLNIKLQICQH